MKDRVALSLVEAAERDGLLIPGEPDQVLIEPSSGNTGIALAMVCRLRGYHLKVVLPTNVSPERRQLLLAFGAEIIDSPGAEGSNGAVRLAQTPERREPRVGLPLPVRESRESAAPTTRRRVPRSSSDVPEITHFVAGLGTSGTLMGVGTLSQGAPSRGADLGGRAAERRDGRRSAQPRGRLRAPDLHATTTARRSSTGKVIVRPRESIEWTRRLTEVGLFAGSPPARRWRVRCKCAASIPDGETPRS